MSANFTHAITWCGSPATVTCDGKCSKAWGINHRPRLKYDDKDPDDFAWLSDGETGEAPADPGTYEGGRGKPTSPATMNKWCARECERSVINCDGAIQPPPDFSERVLNKPSKHPAEATPCQ